VNNASSDETDSVVKSFFSKLPITLIYQPLLGKSNGLNAGIRVATGDLIIFSDDDVEVGYEWISSYMDTFSKVQGNFYFGGPVEVGFEGGQLNPEISSNELVPLSIRGINYGKENIILTGCGASTPFIGLNWGVPRAAFDLVGEFNVGLGPHPDFFCRTGEESDIMRRLNQEGFKPMYIATASIKHCNSKQKSDPKCIAQRIRTYSFEQFIPDKNVLNKIERILGAPLSLYVSLLWELLRWIKSKCFRKTAIDNYFMLNYLYGHLSKWRSVASVTQGKNEY